MCKYTLEKLQKQWVLTTQLLDKFLFEVDVLWVEPPTDLELELKIHEGYIFLEDFFLRLGSLSFTSIFVICLRMLELVSHVLLESEYKLYLDYVINKSHVDKSRPDTKRNWISL